MIYVEMDCYALEKLVYPHTLTQTYRRAGMLVLIYPFPLGVTASRYRLFISLSHLDNFVYTSQLWISFIYQSWIFLFIPVVRNFVYTSLFVYTIHQRPRGGERLAGRYNAEERLRRLLRAGRCAGRVRSVGTSREGRGSSRCRAAGSGRAAASTSM